MAGLFLLAEGTLCLCPTHWTYWGTHPYNHPLYGFLNPSKLSFKALQGNLHTIKDYIGFLISKPMQFIISFSSQNLDSDIQIVFHLIFFQDAHIPLPQNILSSHTSRMEGICQKFTSKEKKLYYSKRVSYYLRKELDHKPFIGTPFNVRLAKHKCHNIEFWYIQRCVLLMNHSSPFCSLWQHIDSVSAPLWKMLCIRWHGKEPAWDWVPLCVCPLSSNGHNRNLLCAVG